MEEKTWSFTRNDGGGQIVQIVHQPLTPNAYEQEIRRLQDQLGAVCEKTNMTIGFLTRLCDTVSECGGNYTDNITLLHMCRMALKMLEG